ncbi:IS1/IS1595 family N-terminal zinc-binding domain-containing protein [Klugiella xanthotipulae]
MVYGSSLVKNGRHRSGTQRWRCPSCGASSVIRRPDVTRREQLRQFVT